MLAPRPGMVTESSQNANCTSAGLARRGRRCTDSYALNLDIAGGSDVARKRTLGMARDTVPQRVDGNCGVRKSTPPL